MASTVGNNLQTERGLNMKQDGSHRSIAGGLPLPCPRANWTTTGQAASSSARLIEEEFDERMRWSFGDDESTSEPQP
jgi:hypothetical protein